MSSMHQRCYWCKSPMGNGPPPFHRVITVIESEDDFHRGTRTFKRHEKWPLCSEACAQAWDINEHLHVESFKR